MIIEKEGKVVKRMSIWKKLAKELKLNNSFLLDFNKILVFFLFPSSDIIYDRYVFLERPKIRALQMHSANVNTYISKKVYVFFGGGFVKYARLPKLCPLFFVHNHDSIRMSSGDEDVTKI